MTMFCLCFGTHTRTHAPLLPDGFHTRSLADTQASGGLGRKCDPDRVVLWGTSYSGGHSLVTAAKMGANISAVIAMVSAPAVRTHVTSVLEAVCCRRDRLRS